jgi:hypothetical protein
MPKITSKDLDEVYARAAEQGLRRLSFHYITATNENIDWIMSYINDMLEHKELFTFDIEYHTSNKSFLDNMLNIVPKKITFQPWTYFIMAEDPIHPKLHRFFFTSEEDMTLMRLLWVTQ